jgi:CRP-like cAMP-binding protein
MARSQRSPRTTGCTLVGMTTEGDARARRAEIPAPTIVDFLATTPLFTGCDRATIAKIAPHVFPVAVPAGIVIVRAGAANPGIGVVYSGRAAVRDGDTTLEEVAAGGAFGETGAFLGTTQPYEIAATEDSVMFLLSHDIVTQLATKIAAFSFAAARRLAAKTITTPPPRAKATGTAPPFPADEIRFVRVSAYDLTPQLIATVPAKLIQQHRLLPLELRDRTLTVGMVDPTSTASRAELQRVMSTTGVIVVAISQDDFNEAYVRLRIDPVRSSRGTRPLEAAVAPE